MSPDYCYNAQVTRIIDGDTLEVTVDVGFRMQAVLPLRVAHIDAPERNTPEGQEAIRFVYEFLVLLPASVVVRTYKPIDKYGRYLADVFKSDRSLSEDMINAGLARPYEGGTK